MGGFDLGYLGKNLVGVGVVVFIAGGDSERLIEHTTEALPVCLVRLTTCWFQQTSTQEGSFCTSNVAGLGSRSQARSCGKLSMFSEKSSYKNLITDPAPIKYFHETSFVV